MGSEMCIRDSFLDFIEIAVVVVPIVTPILLADPSANVTAVWLGVMIGLNIQTSFLTPPFGFALFYLRGVAPKVVKTLDMYKGVVFFIGLQLLALVIVGLNPSLVNYLPNRSSLTSDTAPPPLNPALQYCMEQYVHEQFQANGDELRQSIKTIQGVDLSYLPKKLRKELEEAFEEANGTFGKMDDIVSAETKVKAEADGFRPIHSLVRGIERDIRVLDVEIKDAQQRLQRARGNEAVIATAEADITRLQGEVEELKKLIPAEWDDAQKTYGELTKAERTARAQYRRSVDNAAKPVQEAIAEFEGTQAFIDAKASMDKLVADLSGADNEAAIDLIKAQETVLKEIEGTSDVRKLLAKGRRAMKGKKADREKGDAFIAEATETFDSEIVWRGKAASDLLPALKTYEAAIGNTIALRQQSRLPREQALYVAACSSGHRDIGLNF